MAHLLHEVGEKGIGLVVAHPEPPVTDQHLEEGVQEVQALEVDAGVGLKESQRHPAKEQVQTADRCLLALWVLS